MAVVPEFAPGLGLGARARRPGPCGGSGPSGRHLLAALRLSSASTFLGGPRAGWPPRQRHRTPPGPGGQRPPRAGRSPAADCRAPLSPASARFGCRPSPGGDARTAGAPIQQRLADIRSDRLHGGGHPTAIAAETLLAVSRVGPAAAALCDSHPAVAPTSRRQPFL